MLSPAAHISPSDEVYYQTHRLINDIWLIEEARLDRRQLGHVLDGQGDQIDGAPLNAEGDDDGECLRVVRVTVDGRSQFHDGVVVHYWSDQPEAMDLTMPAVAKPADILWHDADDMYTELASYQLNKGFASFLTSKSLCVEEMLHHPRAGAALAQSWQIMQAGLQPIALQQAQVMDLAGPDRVREMTELMQKLFDDMALRDKAEPPVELTSDNYVEVFAQLQRTTGARFPFEIGRAIAAHLADGPNFTVKLRRLSGLCNAVVTRDQAAPLDRMFASMIQVRGMLNDLAAGRTGVQKLMLLANMMVGVFDGGKGIGVNFDPINELMNAGYLPRSRAAIRRRIVAEAKADGGSATSGDLISELSEIDRIGAQIEQIAPSLIGDTELAAVWQERIGRVLTSENMQRVLVRYRQPTERLSLISSLFPMMRSLENRDQLGRILAQLVSMRDISRELTTDPERFMAPVPPLLKFHQRLRGYQFAAESKDAILGGIDEVISEIVERQMDKQREPDDHRPLIELLKLWLPAPISAGGAQELVRAQLAEAIQNPEFFNSFWASFKSERVREQASHALERLLADYQLKTEWQTARAE
ncbi:MAG: hypothetical protein KI792_10355 [Alphaproteobacteria bacterium]|nr:hypothetical protein [Alphaproteobacteria bacterium SS10]